jgi:orotidine-5'-phosphate decarboxylase
VVNRIVVALDYPDADEARAMAERLLDDVAGFKVGLELVSGSGPGAITTVAALGKPVFADLKLHDIPNTVRGAAKRIAAAGARWVTVHAAGGREMMEAAVAGMGGTGVLAVTVLTSFAEHDLESIGVRSGIENQVIGLAELAVEAEVEGLVCAPGDVAAIRAKGIASTVFTPGIRLEGSTGDDDQKRVGTPVSAVTAGADYLVIGRPITKAPDPVSALREITASLAEFD